MEAPLTGAAKRPSQAIVAPTASAIAGGGAENDEDQKKRQHYLHHQGDRGPVVGMGRTDVLRCAEEHPKE
jgi:hypothetical protein